MSAIEGGTTTDIVRYNILSAVKYEPKETRKSIDEIIREMSVSGNEKKFYQLNADKLVIQRFLYQDLDKKVYVFSKDKDGKYFFKPATRFDRIINYILNFP